MSQNILKNFMNSNDQIKTWPSKRKNKIIILEYLIEKFEFHKLYTEPEINQILFEYHTFNDPALLKRELIIANLLSRTTDCKSYWKTLP